MLFTDGRNAMIFKLLGALLLFLCGASYSRFATKSFAAELDETRCALDLFVSLRSEISQYGTRLDAFFEARGVAGGVCGYLDVLSKGLGDELSEVRRLGRGYGTEEIRICDKAVSLLEARAKRLEGRLSEVKALSRAKGLGLSAVAVILLI